MKINKENNKNKITKITEKDSADQFLERLEVQGVLIKKMLAELDIQDGSEYEIEHNLAPDDKMNFLNFDHEGDELEEINGNDD